MKKYEVYLDGYSYPFKTLACNEKHAESKVLAFTRSTKPALKVVSAKNQKLWVGHPFQAA